MIFDFEVPIGQYGVRPKWRRWFSRIFLTQGRKCEDENNILPYSFIRATIPVLGETQRQICLRSVGRLDYSRTRDVASTGLTRAGGFAGALRHSSDVGRASLNINSEICF